MSTEWMKERRFSPTTDDQLPLFNDIYTFQGRPGSWMRYAAEGGRATVYKVKSSKGQIFALKVFMRQFQRPDIVDSSRYLANIAHLDGFEAANRRIVTEEQAASRHKDLKYAVLMPWVSGKTFSDCLQETELQHPFNAKKASTLAHKFLETVAFLEANGMAHTDLSPGNVIVDLESGRSQLLDLEDFYCPGRTPAPETTPGTGEYQHRIALPTYRPAGDRYAAALLCSHFLLRADSSFSGDFNEHGFYGGNCESPDARAKFELAKDYLGRLAPGFATQLERAWWSDTLENCPTISELYVGLSGGKKPRIVTGEVKIPPPSDNEKKPPNRPPTPLSPPTDDYKGAWGEWTGTSIKQPAEGSFWQSPVPDETPLRTNRRNTRNSSAPIEPKRGGNRVRWLFILLTLIVLLSFVVRYFATR